jgi:hypothetical protein
LLDEIVVAGSVSEVLTQEEIDALLFAIEAPGPYVPGDDQPAEVMKEVIRYLPPSLGLVFKKIIATWDPDCRRPGV